MSQRDCGSGPAVTNPGPSLRPCAVVLYPRAGLRVWARSDVLTIGTVGRARSDEPTTVTLALRRRPVQSLPGWPSLMIVCAPRPDHAPMPTQLLCTQPRLRAGLDAHPPKVLKSRALTCGLVPQLRLRSFGIEAICGGNACEGFHGGLLFAQALQR